VNMVMNLRVPLNVGNFSTNWGNVSFSRKTLIHRVCKPVRTAIRNEPNGQVPYATSVGSGSLLFHIRILQLAAL
jgi:hypothetical protein